MKAIIRIKLPWFLASFVAAALLPYWSIRNVFLLRTSDVQSHDTSTEKLMNEAQQRTTESNGVCEIPSDDEGAVGESSGQCVTSVASTSVGSCTSIQLLLTVWQAPHLSHNSPTVEGLRASTIRLSQELDLDLLSESIQCSDVSTTSRDSATPQISRCLGLFQTRGYLSIYHYGGTSSENGEIQQSRTFYLVDFYIPARKTTGSPKVTIQEYIDRVNHYFADSNQDVRTTLHQPSVWHQVERGFRYRAESYDDEEESEYDEENGNESGDLDAQLTLDIPWVVDMHRLQVEQNRFYKRQIAHVETKFQQVDLYLVLDTRFHVAAARDANNDVGNVGDKPLYDSQYYPEEPDLIVFFDTIMQSRKSGLEAYHEALVQPLLLTHPNPRRVAIFGGGEGATLREVLKHNTVEECVMIEIDGEIVEAFKAFLQDWNDCSDLVWDPNRTHFNKKSAFSSDHEQQQRHRNENLYQSCFDDPRATLYLEDAIGWFVRNYLMKENVPEEEKFDVIILDSLDPGSMLEFSDYMYGNLDFAKALRAALREGGILGGQVGIEKQTDLDIDHDWINLIRNLEKSGFVTLKDYMEAGCGFDDAWKFFVAFTDKPGLSRWFHSDAQTDIEIARRSVLTKSGTPALKYMDGATMASYQAPTRKTENIYCAFLEENGAIDLCFQSAHTNTSNEKVEFGDIHDEIEQRLHSTLVMPRTSKLLDAMGKLHHRSQSMHAYVHNYGSEIYFFGETATIVDLSGGTNETGSVFTADQVDVMSDDTAEIPSSDFYDPSKHRYFLVEKTVSGYL